MITFMQPEMSDKSTSALGRMYILPRTHPGFSPLLIATQWSAATTIDTCNQDLAAMGLAVVLQSERTATDPAGRFDLPPLSSAESPAKAIMEIRRRSGLTWQELGELFDVSRRSVHHWASGKPVTARHDQTIRRMLAAIRHVYRGSQLETRALLRAVDQATGLSMLELLQAGRFNEAMGRVKDVRPPELPRTPLSQAASNARRPPPPVLLLAAEQDRPDCPTSARLAHAKRTPRASS